MANIQLFLLSLLCGLALSSAQLMNEAFERNYQITWGNDHVSFLDSNTVQLSLDEWTGSGFASKLKFGSGFFNMCLKLPNNTYTGGLVIAFYMSSGGSRQDELDFEFLGHTIGEPYRLQTNVFTHGQGGREQKISLWFDPTQNCHNYKILWNQHQIVFYIDDIPIRVYKNNTNIVGSQFPTQPMNIIASLWNGETWATNGGKAKMDYSYAPFQTQFRRFTITGCPVKDITDSNRIQECFTSTRYWWNSEQYWDLTPTEKTAYQNVVNNNMLYDYCKDSSRYPTPPPEC